VDLRLACERDGFVEPFGTGKIDAAVAAPAARGNGDDVDRPAARRREHIPAFDENLRERGTNGSQARNADLQGISHGHVLTFWKKPSADTRRADFQRWAFSEMTLCIVSSAVERNFLMLRAAW